ncbi:MAG: hypothetical protein GYB68_14950, partial [Chloroflexi bacterium]|nr:hypothetical protein [Chloroflexota bacterium]
RTAAIHALAARWEMPRLVPLAATNWVSVKVAAEWLADNGDARVIPVLVAALRRSGHPTLHRNVAHAAISNALMRLVTEQDGDASLAVRALRHALEDDSVNSWVARHLISALEGIGTDEAHAAIIVFEANRQR